ncbi:MAG: hypothetical protein QOH68_650 [Nocardioidaceae bacterium]|nr:hypothetical protein [Nocardioidaceae bacterium]
MGIFFEHRDAAATAKVKQALEDAYRQEAATPAEAQVRAAGVAPAVVAQAAAPAFQPARFFGALAIVAALIALGIFAEANGWKDSSKAVFALATTLFGVVVGLLGGEKSAV